MRKNRTASTLLFFCLLINLSINIGCKTHPRKKISSNEFASIKKSCPIGNYPVSLYYLDGNCSFCLAKAKEFDDKKYGRGTDCVILFQTANPIMTKMYIQDISLRSCVILDSTDVFAKSLTLNTSYEISDQREILFESVD